MYLEIQRISTSHVMKKNIWQYIFWEQLQALLQHSHKLGTHKGKCLCVLLAALSLVPRRVLHSTDTE